MAMLQSLENAVENVCQVDDSPQSQGQSQDILTPRIAPRPKNDGGGYDCEFVDPPPKALQTDCSICLQILREPYLISCCGHSFCWLCIKRIKQDGKSCPLCNEPNYTLVHNKGLQRTLGEFCVRCTHQKAGCQWTGELGKLDQHLNVKPVSEKQLEGCSFVEVECLHCHEYLMRCLIKEHQEEQCSKRPYSCDYCREYSSTFEDVEANHWPVCPCYFVSCPNECNWPHITERQNLDHHLAKECPLQVVICDFHYAGCEVRLPRKDMPQHITETFTHISLLATLNQKLTNQLLKKDEQNVQLTKELQKMVEESQTQVQMLREENQMLKQQLAENAEQTQTLKHELTKETRTLKDQLGEQGEQQDALNHSVTMLREQQAQQQQEQTRLAEQTMNELGQQGQMLRTELTRETQALKDQLGEQGQTLRTELKLKHDALNQSLTRVREQQVQQTRQQQNTEAKIYHLERDQGLNQQKVDKCFDALPLNTTIPQILMTDFARHKRDNEQWYSEPFYSHLGGYKMRLRVDANGDGDGKGTHVSVFVYLMCGQHDSSLKWPFRGEVTIQLLNQLGDGEYRTEIIPFTDQSPGKSTGRVTGREMSREGLGFSQYIHHTKLGKYLRNDCLCFRVSRADLK